MTFWVCLKIQKCEIVVFCQDFMTFDIYVNVLNQKSQFQLESLSFFIGFGIISPLNSHFKGRITLPNCV